MAANVSGTITIFQRIHGTNSLTLANSSDAPWTGSLTLSNFEVGIDTLSFSAAAGLTGAQLNAIQLSGYSATGFDSNGVVQFTAVPEPSAIRLALCGATALMFIRPKRAEGVSGIPT